MMLFEIGLGIVVVLLILKVMALSWRVRRIHKYLVVKGKRELEVELRKFTQEVEKDLEKFINKTEIDKNKSNAKTSRGNGKSQHKSKTGATKIRKSTSKKKK